MIEAKDDKEKLEWISMVKKVQSTYQLLENAAIALDNENISTVFLAILRIYHNSLCVLSNF